MPCASDPAPRRLAALLVLFTATLAEPARADWPMARHDAKRRGVATGKGDLQKPVVGWRAYLGGSLSAEGPLAADVDGDGVNELIVASGGTVSAVRLDGSIVWRTPPSDNGRLLGIADLDGDGRFEVVAYATLGARAIDLATGAIVWAQPPGEMGAVRSAVRLADLNGDGRPDLVIPECRGCGGDKPQSGFIYSFENGFKSPHRSILKYPDFSASAELTLVDMDGKGGAEILIGTTSSRLALLDASGNLIAESPDLDFGSAYVSGCLPQNLDGVPGDEVICMLSSGDPAPGTGDKSKVFALRLTPGPSPSLDVLWSRSLSPNEGIGAQTHDLIVDVDGDGVPETLITGRDASGGHTVHILRSATGAELATIPGGVLFGTAPALPGGVRAILTGVGSGVSAWTFTNGAVQSLGSLGDGYPLPANDWARFAISSAAPSRPMVLDVNGDGAGEIFMVNAGKLSAYTLGKTAPTLVGSVPFTTDEPFAGGWPFPAMDRPYPQLGVAQADGTLRFLDHGLSYTSAVIRFGGYYAPGAAGQLGASPVVASLGDPAQQILVSDSRHVLLRLDASKATADVPPTKVWERTSFSAPLVASDVGDGSPGVFALRVVDPAVYPPEYKLVRLRPDGSTVWEVPVDKSPPKDFVLARFDSDASPDIALQSAVTNSPQIATYAISGLDGHTIWSNVASTCGLPGGVSVTDWNGDGFDDVVQQLPGGTQIASGVDGTLLASGGPVDCYYLPIPVDVNGDGVEEMVFQGGYNSERLYPHDLSAAAFVGAEDDRPYPYGAIARCADGQVFIEGSWAFPSRLKMTTLGGPNAGSARTVFLASGALYQDEASANAVSVAQLTAVNVHENLTGTGRPSAVVGSGDGFLYAVDPCSGDLDFAYDFGSPVGEAVFGDTDGDGLDEVIVSVADGYLYDLRNQVVGTGGSGGTGGTTGSGGAGGTTQAGGGIASDGGGFVCGEECRLYGRGGCYCEAGASSSGGAGAVIGAGFLAWIAAGRRRRRVG